MSDHMNTRIHSQSGGYTLCLPAQSGAGYTSSVTRDNETVHTSPVCVRPRLAIAECVRWIIAQRPTNTIEIHEAHA